MKKPINIKLEPAHRVMLETLRERFRLRSWAEVVRRLIEDASA